jgi:RecJ-like exonuclease
MDLTALKKAVRTYWLTALITSIIVAIIIGAALVVAIDDAKALALELTVTVLVGIGAFLLTSLLGHKFKLVSEFIGKRACERCEKGQNICQTCSGSGRVDDTVEERVDCASCGGRGRVNQPCSTCSGSRNVNRPAQYNRIGPTSSVRYELNPLHGMGHWQAVTVGAQNAEQQGSTFGVTVDVPGSTSTRPLGDSLHLGPGASGTLTFEFKIHGARAYSVVATITAGIVSVPCPTCSGTGLTEVSCTTCSGTGKVGQPKQVKVPCRRCDGRGKVPCDSCGGTGKVQRVP